MRRYSGPCLSAHDVIQGLHRFFNRSEWVEAVDLVEIDIVGAEAAQAVVDLSKDRGAGQALAVRAGTHAAEYFGREHSFLAGRQFLQQGASYLFAGALRVDIGRVEEIDA